MSATPLSLSALTLTAALLGGTLALPLSARADAVSQSEAGPIRITEVARGLENPWALAFLPDGRLLVTERPGRMRIVSASGELSPPIAGVPAVHARGQGGLLDVVLAPDFASSRRIYFSYAQPASGGARSAVASATLDLAGLRLTELKVIFTQRDAVDGNNHWGSRLVFDRAGNLFITLGDRYSERDRAQDLGTHFGKIVRIRPDGGVPADNPYAGRPGVLPEIWSYGHRNVQGAALHPQTGELWATEHGPQGGDELNRVLAGRNYGWPVITHGREYVTGFRIGEGAERADVEPSRWQWTPSIAPSGLAFYSGDAFPAWKGNVFAGALKFRLLARLVLDGDKVVKEERLLTDQGIRIRDVRQGPDGRLWLLDDGDGRVLRLDPA